LNPNVTIAISKDALAPDLRQCGKKRKRKTTKSNERKPKKRSKKVEQEKEDYIISEKGKDGPELKVVSEFIPTETHNIEDRIKVDSKNPSDKEEEKKKDNKSKKKKPKIPPNLDKNQPSLEK